MLPGAHRLRTDEVTEVFRTGKPLFVMGLGVRFLKKPHQSTKFSFVVGKKFLSRAVDRNRFRRLARAGAISLQEKWPAGYNIVVFVAKKPVILSREALKEALSVLLTRIHP